MKDIKINIVESKFVADLTFSILHTTLHLLMLQFLPASATSSVVNAALVSTAVAVFSSNMLIVIKNSLVHWMSEAAAAECCLSGQLSIRLPSFQV